MTIARFSLLQNIGQFDSVANADALTKLVLVYAENGRGKTTLSAVLRSLKSGDPVHILERHRLGAVHPPRVEIVASGGRRAFQAGAWSGHEPDIEIFDDAFVADNVCSGMQVEPSHRQNLHELILGSAGVALNNALRQHAASIEEHNRVLRQRETAIPAARRGGLSVDDFCALAARPDINDAITEAERILAAARAAEAVQQRNIFVPLELPTFEVAEVNQLLAQTLADVTADAGERVRQHMERLGRGAEAWLTEGMERLAFEHQHDDDGCPFCAQALTTSPILPSYRTYFSDSYQSLKAAISNAIGGVNRSHSFESQAAFERALGRQRDDYTFWSTFTGLNPFVLDGNEVRRVWNQACEAILEQLREKLANPLQPTTLSSETLQLVEAYNAARAVVADASANLVASNILVAGIKEMVGSANVSALEADLLNLRLIAARYDPALVPLCDEYRAEKARKVQTELLRDQAREALDQYRTSVFPAYQTSINTYLARFNAGFRLDNVNSVNNRVGSAANYTVVINNVPVSPTATTGPSFRNTLSAGDRNTLALAFFFATLERAPDLPQKIVVIDDPMTSLDEHRSLSTVQEMRRLLPRVAQMVILSHSKPFLCTIWDGADAADRCALNLIRATDGSTLARWDVTRDLITEHDRRHDLLHRYLNAADPAIAREVATALRPIMEAFVRVAYPTFFPPGARLGQFHGRCVQALGTPAEILDVAASTELRQLLDYANRFHHDTNAAYATEAINDLELVGFAERVIRFSRKS